MYARLADVERDAAGAGAAGQEFGPPGRKRAVKWADDEGGVVTEPSTRGREAGPGAADTRISGAPGAVEGRGEPIEFDLAGRDGGSSSEEDDEAGSRADPGTEATGEAVGPGFRGIAVKEPQDAVEIGRAHV